MQPSAQLQILSGLAGLLMSLNLSAATVRKTIAYQVGETKMSGVLVFDDASKSKQPGLVLVPNWMGINEANLKQAEKVAGMGYVVFVSDMYGVAVRPKNAGEAGKASGAVKGDRALKRLRAQSALSQLQTSARAHQVKLDVSKLGAIGFCFGGTAALELGRSGAALSGVVSFHGGLDSPLAYDEKAVRAAALVLHGADDPYVPAAEVNGFSAEMREKGWNWELISYGGAVHSFTDVDANAKGQADYNAKVATRAYARMQEFFAEVFQAR